MWWPKLSTWPGFGQAAPVGGPNTVRLAGYGPARPRQPSLSGPRAQACPQEMTDAGFSPGGSPPDPGQHRHVHRGRLARSRSDRPDGLFLYPREPVCWHAGSGILPAGQAVVGLVIRERRQAPRNAGPPQHGGLHGRRPARSRHQERPDRSTISITAGKIGQLTDRQVSRKDVYRMIRCRSMNVGIPTAVNCHTFRATGSQLTY